jgi:nucleotide-binding universal stress UspA family protein
MISAILVPLDGSAFGEHALPMAIDFALRAGATLKLVHVHTTIPAEGMVMMYAPMEPPARERELTYLQSVAKRVRTASGVRVTTDLLDGPVPDAISEYAQATGSDLMLLCTHGRGPLSRFWLGSVADELIPRTAIPVLLVKPNEDLADFSKKPVLRRFLIPLDGSELAEQILEPAVELGNLTGAGFTLLRVIEPLPVLDYRTVELEDKARDYLDRVASFLQERSLQVQTRVIVQPDIACAIVAEAQAHSTNLIALATHGRRGLARVMAGSVADKVLRGASTHVLILHPLLQRVRSENMDAEEHRCRSNIEFQKRHERDALIAHRAGRSIMSILCRG